MNIIEIIENKKQIPIYENLEKIKEELLKLKNQYKTISILEFNDFYLIDADDIILCGELTESEASEIGIETIF